MNPLSMYWVWSTGAVPHFGLPLHKAFLLHLGNLNEIGVLPLLMTKPKPKPKPKPTPNPTPKPQSPAIIHSHWLQGQGQSLQHTVTILPHRVSSPPLMYCPCRFLL